MILNLNTLEPINISAFDTLLDTSCPHLVAGVDENGLEYKSYRYAKVNSSTSMIAIPYAYVVFLDGKPCFVAQLESLDLRLLSDATGTSVKELQREYETKSFYTEPRIMLYSNGIKEDLGVYQGRGNDEEIFSFLKSLATESFITEDEGDYSAWLYSEENE